MALLVCTSSGAGEFNAPWRDKSKALIIDAYELNAIDWEKLVSDKRVVGFIAKASDGLQPPYGCTTRNETQRVLCKKTFRNHWLKQELYRTRRAIAKNLGLEWGAYHLGRAGNPEEQANHFIRFADPAPDDLIVLDIEQANNKAWMSLKEAERFAMHLKRRIGRYPMLYINNDTAKIIAANTEKYPLLSRLKLWYARYKASISGVFPLGNWDSYTLWQFSSRINCRKKSCPYRVKGTPYNIDINVSNLEIDELRKAWPFDGLLPQKPQTEPDTLVVGTLDEPEKPDIAEPAWTISPDRAEENSVQKGEIVRLTDEAIALAEASPNPHNEWQRCVEVPPQSDNLDGETTIVCEAR